jgi:anti-sigma B factor antagonist
MAINTERVGKVEIIYPVNDLDSVNGNEIKSYVLNIIDEVDAVYINFSRVSYLNSSGLRELIQTLKIVQENQKKMALTNLSDNIKKIFINTNLHKLFNIFINDEAANEQL